MERYTPDQVVVEQISSKTSIDGKTGLCFFVLGGAQMSTGEGNRKSCDISDLPVQRRTIRVPAELWKSVKSHSEDAGRSIRFLVDDALDAELMTVIESLRQLGFRGEEKADKLVLIPLNDNIIGRINYGRRQTGLPAVSLLRACLSRFVQS